jgi:hypothetical protein
MALAYLWRAYQRLRHRKGGSGFGASPLEWPDIEAFLRQGGMTLVPWEIALIEMLDDLYMNQQAKTQRAQYDRSPKPNSK